MNTAPSADPSYLDVQAAIGITKHNGGYPATDRLLSICHIGEAQTALYVGSGIGVGPAYIAKHHGCRVVAADISERMLEWTRRRIRQDGVADEVEPVLADVCSLPFEDGRFDIVMVESVLAFVEQKQLAISECIRVTRPGGWVGMSEAVWKDERPEESDESLASAMGTWLPTSAEWRFLWQDSALAEQVFELHDIALAEEARSRIQWIGWRWLLPAWGRALKLAATDAAARDALRTQLQIPPSLAEQIGYVISAGRKA
jgi:SAM-dependent methyltransferase